MPVWNKIKNADIIFGYYDNGEYLDKFTKPQILANHTIDKDKLHPKGGLWAAFLTIRNNERSRHFIKSWLDLCCRENYLSGEGFGPGKHQEDQAILNLAHALRNDDLKTDYIEEQDLQKILIWHHRKPGREHQTLTSFLKKQLSGFERKLWEADWLGHLRYQYRNSVKTRLQKIEDQEASIETASTATGPSA